MPSAVDLRTIVANPACRYEPFPLNEIQQAYWVGRGGDFELGQVSIHRYIEIDADDLDLKRLSWAWRQLVDRHEMLRVIVRPDGQQQILKEVPAYEIKVLDLRGKGREEQESRLDDVRQRMSHQVLASDKWPIFEIRATRLNDRRFRIHLSLDGLIFDAWSRCLLLREWGQLYENPETELPPLELSFRDYVLAEADLENTEEYQRAQQYWRDRLATLPAPPELPFSSNPASIKKPRFERRSARLDTDTWERLKAGATQAGLTPTGVLISTFAEILAIWSKHPHFTINLTIFNRLPRHPQVNEIVGDFTSLLPLEVDHRHEARFKDRAQRLRKELSKDLEHRQFSGIKIARELGRLQQKNRAPLMPVVFTRYLAPHGTCGDHDTLSWIGDVGFVANQTPQVWIDMQVGEEEGGLGIHCDTVKELFPEGMMEDMFEAYCQMLRKLATHEHWWTMNADELARSLIPQAQFTQRARANAMTAPASEDLLHTLFAAKAAEQPDHPAVIAPDRTLSYKQTEDRARSIARRLRDLGARPNSLVAVVMHKGWEQVVGVLAVQYSGAAYLPIDPAIPKQRLKHLLKHGEVELVLTQSEVEANVGWPNGVKSLCVDSEEFRESDMADWEPVQKPSDLAYVIYTSGSTGQPKGVMIDHRGAVNTILDVNRRFEVGPADRVLGLASLGFDLSVYDIFGTLAAGASLVLPDSSGTKDPAHWAELIDRHGVTIWNSVPALMELLTEYVAARPDDSRLDSLRLVLLSGDWIPVSLPERIGRCTADALAVGLGGATEASIWSNLFVIDQDDPHWAGIPYGKPMTNQRFHVLNESLAPCPVWVPGELHIGGDGLAMGYWRDEEATRSSFIKHPITGERLYRTGDLGRYLPDGNLEFLGRIDSQVKVQGYRVELNEIETTLARHPDVRAALVAAAGPKHGEKRLIGYVVPAADAGPLNQLGLRSFLSESLPDYMLPSQFVFLDELPLSANGKLDRKRLPEPPKVTDEAIAGNESRRMQSASSITTKEQRSGDDPKYSQFTQRVSELVSQVLKIERIDQTTDFLNFGATSLDMIRIANRVDEELGCRPDMDEFFQEPTVRGLVRNIQSKMQRENVAPVVSEADNRSTPADTLVESFDLIVDPAQREAFKKRQPGLRRFARETPTIPLSNGEPDDNIKEKYMERRSHRRFSQDPIPFSRLAELLRCLRPITVNGEPKYFYGSAGGLYPVQCYLYVKPERVESLGPGTYYYDPQKHRLVLISADARVDRSAYDLLINRPIFDRAAFGIFLIAQLSAIAPMYREHSVHYATIEAGLMCQLLESAAAACGMGLCQIGSLNLPGVRDLFDLTQSHALVHSLLGGGIHCHDATGAWSPGSTEIGHPDLHQREEGEL